MDFNFMVSHIIICNLQNSILFKKSYLNFGYSAQSVFLSLSPGETPNVSFGSQAEKIKEPLP